MDSPNGYGIRLEYLRIAMTESEQFAYFAESGNKLEYALERHSREIRNLARKIDTLQIGQNFAVQTAYRIAARLGEQVPLPSASAFRDTDDLMSAENNAAPMSAALTPSFLLAGKHPARAADFLVDRGCRLVIAAGSCA